MEMNEAYLVGYTIGDGCLYSCSHVFSLDPRKSLMDYEITWGDKDLEQLGLIERIVKSLFPHVYLKTKIRKKSKGKILRCRIKKVFLHLKELLSKDMKSETKENIAAFISGFCDAEGDIGKTNNGTYKGKIYYKPRIQVTQKDKAILEQIKELLEKKFNIKPRIHKKWDQDAYILQISGCKQVSIFKKEINFRNPTKCAKLESILSSVQSSPKL